jgi:hypothetical protein
MKYIKLLAIVALAVVILNGCCSLDPNDGVENTDYSAKATFALQVGTQDKSKIHVEGVTGNIKIVGTAADQTCTISGVREVRSDSDADAKEHLQELEVRLTETDNEILVETIQPDKSDGRTYTVHYEIKCPASLAVEIDNVTGEVEVQSLTNTVNIDLVNGNVTTQDINANLLVDVTNGYVDSEMVLPAGGSSHIKSVNGVIKIKIPQTTSAELSANVTNGRVIVTDLQMNYLNNSPKNVRGILNGGNGHIDVSATNGDIQIQGLVAFL